jgi:hypothetical protein
MTKDDLIILFKNYNENKSKLELRKREKRMIEARLNAEEDIETSMSSATGINSDIRSKNIISDKVGNAVIKSISKREEDEKRLKELNQEIIKLQDKVEEIEIRLRRTKIQRERNINSLLCRRKNS